MEICLNNEWGTVCDQMWGLTDARVVCRQLGIPDTGSKLLQCLVLCIMHVCTCECIYFSCGGSESGCIWPRHRKDMAD